MIVEGNVVDGWRHALSCRPKGPSGDPATCVIRNNTVSGSISLLGPPEQFRKHVQGSLDVEALEPVQEHPIPEKDFGDEEYKM